MARYVNPWNPGGPEPPDLASLVQMLTGPEGYRPSGSLQDWQPPEFAPEMAQQLHPSSPDWLTGLAQALSSIGPYQPGRFEGGGSRFAGGLLSGLAHGISAPVLAGQQKREA